MGVQRWRARLPLPGAKNSIEVVVFHIMDAEHAVVGALLLEDRVNDQPEKVARLMNAIMAAIQLQVVEADVIDPNGQFIIIMGECGEVSLPEHAVCHRLPHPVDVLKNPLLKADIWRSIKILRHPGKK